MLSGEGYVFVPMPDGATLRTIKIPTTGTDSPLTGDEKLILHLHNKVADLARLTEENESLRKTNANLQRDLADPPPDVQEAVLRKLAAIKEGS